MEDKKLYMVVNCGEMANYSLFKWSVEELQSAITLFARINEQDVHCAPVLYIYRCKEQDIIPVEEIQNQDWYQNGGYSINELDVFKLDKQAYTWKDEWFSIYDCPRIWPYKF